MTKIKYTNAIFHIPLVLSSVEMNMLYVVINLLPPVVLHPTSDFPEEQPRSENDWLLVSPSDLIPASTHRFLLRTIRKSRCGLYDLWFANSCQ